MDTRWTKVAKLAAGAIALTACAESPGTRPTTPRKYDGKCVLAGIEEVPAPIGQEGDAVVMVARYRPSDDGQEASRPLGLRFQVARAREHDLRLHIQSHSTVLCEVGGEASASGAERISLPPFEGQPGTVER